MVAVCNEDGRSSARNAGRPDARSTSFALRCAVAAVRKARQWRRLVDGHRQREVSGQAWTVVDCVTDGAALYDLFPAWVAVTEHVPAAVVNVIFPEA